MTPCRAGPDNEDQFELRPPAWSRRIPGAHQAGRVRRADDASREHLRQIVPVVREALQQAGLKLTDLDAIGVTQGPGLVGALLVGITYGKTLAQALGKPLIPVNHLEGHVHAVFLEAHKAGKSPKLPAVCLIVSVAWYRLFEHPFLKARAQLRRDA